MNSKHAILGEAARRRSTAANGKRCATAAANAACTSSRMRRPACSIRPTSPAGCSTGSSGRCLDYKRRMKLVPDCVRLDRKNLGEIDWLPSTCAYRLRAEGKPLRDWHYLISGSRETVHEAGMSMRGWTVCEDEAGRSRTSSRRPPALKPSWRRRCRCRSTSARSARPADAAAVRRTRAGC